MSSPASTATCRADVNFPLSGRDDSDGGLFVLRDVTTSTGKRIVAFSLESCLAILNQAHEVMPTLMELLRLHQSSSSRSGLCEETSEQRVSH